jgi:CheY-like chemotaxis protein
LAISSRLVELMGGRIWVESELGRGSEFHFTAAFGLPTEAPRARPVGGESLRDIRILIVDDNQTNCFILEEMVRNWQMEPAVLTRPEEAISLIADRQREGRPFHILLLDANMPNVRGPELAKQIADNADLARLGVILLTSGSSLLDADERRRLGISACLTKPIKQSELLDAITESLGGAKLAEPVSAGASVAELRDRLPPLRILLAEDSVVNQKLALALLAPYGHTVVIANNGAEAVRHCAANAFDIVLMDVQMPEMDGLEATRLIREAERATGRHTPILALTAHAIKGDRELCLETGMDAYISKPVRATELYGALDELLKDHPRATASGTSEAPESSEHQTSENSLDWSAALAESGLGEATLVDLASLFVSEAPELLKQLRAALANRDAASLTRAVHTLKSNVAIFHATTTVEAAQRLESLARSGDLEAAPAAAACVERECSRLLSALVARTKEAPLHR